MFRILSVDGGGMRGVIAAHWLDMLQKTVGRPLSECFDLVVGTSTGSILAAAVVSELVKPETGKSYTDFYKDYGSKIFKRKNPITAWMSGFLVDGIPYDLKELENALKKEFGASKKLKSVKPKLMIPTYETVTRQPFWFKSYDEISKEFFIWQACLASCAAPTYFPALALNIEQAEKCLIDGGVVANNPSACALAEAADLLHAESIIDAFKHGKILLISMGTGNLNRPIKKEDAQSWGALGWVRPFIDVVFDATSSANDLICRKILPRDLYFRFQVDLKGANDDLDDASKTNIQNLINLADGFINQNGGFEFSELVTTLKSKASS